MPTILSTSAGREMWRWTEADIAKVKRYKKANYQVGGGRPRSTKRPKTS